MEKVKSFGKRSLSMFLALLMCLSCMTAGFMAVSAYTPPSGHPSSSNTRYGKDNIKYNSLDWAVYSDEQVATALLDNLDKLLQSMNIRTELDLSVMVITIDLRSVNRIFETIRGIDGKLTPALKGMLGSLSKLDLSAAYGITRESKTSIEIIQALLQLLYNNNSLVRDFLDGSLSLGIANGFIPGGSIYNLIGNALGVSFDTNNLVYSLIKPIMVKALYPNTSSAQYAAAMKKTLDDFVFQDVLEAAFNPTLDEDGNNVDTGYPAIKFWDPTVKNEAGQVVGGWSLLLPDFHMQQSDIVGDALYRAFSIIWDNCLKKLISTIKYVPDFDLVHNDIVSDGKIDVTTLWGKLLYNKQLNEGVLDLDFSDSTILTDAKFDFTKYKSLVGGVNDFLKYALPYFFPKYDFNANWVSGDVTKLIPNAVKLLGYVCDSIDPDILASIGGAKNLTANNFEPAFLPFAKALLKHFAPVVHQDTMDKITSFETLAKEGAKIYAAQILPKNTYSDSASYLDVVRDITAYEMSATIPLYRGNSVTSPDKNIYDVYATNNQDTLWDVLNYVLCYYAEDRGISKLFVTGTYDQGNVKPYNITRSNTLWQNLDLIVNSIPLFKDLLNNGANISTEQLILNDIIGNLMDGKIEPVLNKFIGMFSSNVMTNGKVMEVIYNNIKALFCCVANRGSKFIPNYQSSPFDNLLQKNNINNIIQYCLFSDIFYLQRDFLWTPLMFLLQTVSGFVGGFMDEIKEQTASITSVSIAKPNYTGTLSFDTTATIKNTSYGNDRAVTVGYNSDGTAKREYDNKYISRVTKVEIMQDGKLLEGASSSFTQTTLLNSLDQFDVSVRGTVKSSGIVTIKVTYDILGENKSSPIAKDKVSTAFITLSNQSSYFDDVYSFNENTSKYEFKSGAQTVSWGTGLGANNGASFAITAPSAFMYEADKLSQTTANSTIKIAGTGYKDDASVKSHIFGIYGVPYDTDNDSAIYDIDLPFATRDDDGNWLDEAGNVILDYVDGEITDEAVSKCGNQTGIPGLKFSLTDTIVANNNVNFSQFIKWDGVTDVAPGAYPIKFVLVTDTSRTIMTTTVYVADTNAYSLNENLPEEEQIYHGRDDLQAVYNSALDVYNKYARTDFTDKAAWDRVEALLTSSLTTISTPIRLDNYDKLAQSYNSAYDLLKQAYDTLVASLDKSIVNQVELAKDKDYASVDFVRAGYSSMNNKLWSAESLAATGTASSFEIGEAVRQYKLAVDRMVKRATVTTKLDQQIQRQSLHNEADYAKTRWSDYQKALATAIEYSNKAINGGNVAHTIIRKNLDFDPTAPIPVDKYGNEITVSDKGSGLNTKEVRSSYLGPVLQSDVNSAMWDLMMAEENLTLPERLLYKVENIEVTPPKKTSFTVGEVVTKESLITDGLSVIANIKDVEPGSPVQGPTMDVTADITVSNIDTSKAGTQTVTISYFDLEGNKFTDTFTVNVVGRQYTVKFNSDEPGMGGEFLWDYLVEEGNTCPDPYTDPAKPDCKETFDFYASEYGLVFVGWSEDLTNITANMEVYPVFSEGDVQYAINYNVDSDTTLPDNAVTSFVKNPESPDYVAEIQLPVAVKEGYNFIGWCTDEALATTPIMVLTVEDYDTDVDLYPVFEVKSTGVKVSGYISGMTSLNNQEVANSDKVIIADAKVTLYGDDGITAIEGVSPVVNDANGYFEFTGIKDGTYVLSITGSAILARNIIVTVSGSDVAVSTADRMIGVVNADFANDGYINANDYTAFMTYMGTNSSSSKWNPNADLNGDGYVNASDYAIYMSFTGKNSENAYKEWVII